jgi:hypothetical protein
MGETPSRLPIGSGLKQSGSGSIGFRPARASTTPRRSKRSPRCVDGYDPAVYAR